MNLWAHGRCLIDDMLTATTTETQWTPQTGNGTTNATVIYVNATALAESEMTATAPAENWLEEVVETTTSIPSTTTTTGPVSATTTSGTPTTTTPATSAINIPAFDGVNGTLTLLPILQNASSTLQRDESTAAGN